MKLILALFALCLVLGADADMSEEAKVQLDSLNSTVRGEIMSAHDDLSSIALDFLTHSQTTLQQCQIDIASEHETVLATINQLKDLAAGRGCDASPCTDVRLQVLNMLPNEFVNQTRICINSATKGETSILDDAAYVVDITYNKIGSYDFQVKQCNGDINCLTPVINAIELDIVKIPQSIQETVMSAQNDINVVKLNVETCSKTQITEYIAHADAIEKDVVKCMDETLTC